MSAGCELSTASLASRPALASAERAAIGPPGRRIRVAFCIDAFVVGGTEMNAVRTAEALDPGRFELRIFHLGRDGPLRPRYEALGVGLVHVPIPNLYSPRTLAQGQRFARSLRQWGADIAHTHDLYTNIFAAPWARLAGDCRVLASRRWWYDAPRPGLVPVNRWCNRFAHRILANSRSVARLLVEEEGVPESKVLEIPNFLDERAFEPLPEATIRERKRAWGIPPEAFVVGIVARLAPVKNHELLLRALRLAPPDVHLVLIGDGPSRPSLLALAEALHITGRVHFGGEILSGANLHGCFDASVLCSRSEGFPNALIEALAAGRPVVATPVGSVPEVIEDAVTGLLSPADDPGALAAALGRLRTDAGLRRRLGSCGRELVRSRFARATVIAKLAGAYESLSAGRCP